MLIGNLLFWGWALTHQEAIPAGVAMVAAAGGVAAAYLWFGVVAGLLWLLGRAGGGR